MMAAANLDGVELKLASAARNFDYQADIWNKKWTGETLVDGQKLPESIPDGFARFKKILEYSAAPGTSRHHWGTDVDIYYAVPSFFETSKGKKIYNWLSANAPKFGFCQVYDAKITRFSGYNEEKWHWSYLPLAKDFTERYKTLIRESDLGGFLGAEYLGGQNVINDYVLSINPDCL
jgi:LAS superfamily LD-carboxypeptidase LdcB